ncbi:MAG: zinc-dependent peptidase, partial [Actinobacteria bacterium]|nr:zinc-dependent peptidase [Actinomycetota bacterium]
MSWFDWLFRGGSSEAATMPAEWRAIVERRVPHWAFLDDEEQDRLEAIALHLIGRKRWEAANGFEVTDEIVVTISAQAALLALGLPDGVYRKVRTIVVHPSTLVLHGEHSYGGGIMSRDPQAVLGLVHSSGTVVIVWDAVLDDARHPKSGHNVVLHEFAHQLDLLDGVSDGTPPVATAEQFDRWVAVCTQTYGEVNRGRGGSSLRSYAGVNPSEFFAVATEAFFGAPAALRREHRDLYDV